MMIFTPKIPRLSPLHWSVVGILFLIIATATVCMIDYDPMTAYTGPAFPYSKALH